MTARVRRISQAALAKIIYNRLALQHEEVGIIGKPEAAPEFAAAIYKLWSEPGDGRDFSDEDAACALGYVADAFAAIAEWLTIERERREARR